MGHVFELRRTEQTSNGVGSRISGQLNCTHGASALPAPAKAQVSGSWQSGRAPGEPELGCRALASILVLSNMYPPHHYGGYELSCRDVVERWRKAGHNVTVLTSTMRVRGVADSPDEREQGILRDLAIFYDAGRLTSPPIHRRVQVERTNQRILADTIRTSKPDVISIWHMGAMSTGLLTSLVQSGIPLAYVVCDDWPTYAYKIDPWMKLWYRHPRVGRRIERLVGVPATLPDAGA